MRVALFCLFLVFSYVLGAPTTFQSGLNATISQNQPALQTNVPIPLISAPLSATIVLSQSLTFCIKRNGPVPSTASLWSSTTCDYYQVLIYQPPPPTQAPVAPTQVVPTQAPTTAAPTQVAPTQAPTTVAPPTQAPTTVAPPTQAPTTVAPPTTAPTTVAPPTTAPTTVAPPTTAPTTVAPAPTVAVPGLNKRSSNGRAAWERAVNSDNSRLTSGSGLITRSNIFGGFGSWMQQNSTLQFSINFPYSGGSTSWSYGFYYLVPSNQSTNIEFSMSAASCDSTAEIPPTCVLALPTGQGGAVTLPPGSTQYYFNTNVGADPSVTLSSLSLTTTNVSIAKQPVLIVQAAYQRVPSATSNDGSGNNAVTVPVPPSGTWYFAVTNPNTSTSTANFTTTYSSAACNISSGFAGPNCMTPFSTLQHSTNGNATTVELSQGSSITYLVNIAAAQAFFFSAAQSPQPTNNPAVFVRQGNLPSNSSASPYNNANGCNTGACVVQQIIINPAATGPWFVTVYNSGSAALNYVVWLDWYCPNNCSSGSTQGTCNQSGPQQGLCECPVDKAATFYCSPTSSSSGLPVEYIVLIIIGSLVVLSAIIGFIAWAYMRRKRIHYEKV